MAQLSETWDSELDLDVISYGAGASAGEEALAPLSEMWELKLELDVSSYGAGGQRGREGRSVAAGFVSAQQEALVLLITVWLR